MTAPVYTENVTQVLPGLQGVVAQSVNNSSVDSATDGITAGGGTSATSQSGSTVLTTKFNRVTTVPAANASVSIGIAATPGASFIVRNDAATNSMNMYPVIGGTDKINALSANAAFAMAAAGGSVTFRCYTAGIWLTT